MKKQILKTVAQTLHTSAVAAKLPVMIFGAGLVFSAMNVQADSEIGGEVEIDVSVENVICAAIGDDNSCQIRAGAIVDSDIGGDVEIQVNAENVIGAAIGTDNSVEINMGTVANSEIGGSVEISVTAGNIIAAAIGTGNSAEVSLGAIK